MAAKSPYNAFLCAAALCLLLGTAAAQLGGSISPYGPPDVVVADAAVFDNVNFVFSTINFTELGQPKGTVLYSVNLIPGTVPAVYFNVNALTSSVGVSWWTGTSFGLVGGKTHTNYQVFVNFTAKVGKYNPGSLSAQGHAINDDPAGTCLNVVGGTGGFRKVIAGLYCWIANGVGPATGLGTQYIYLKELDD